MTLETTFGGQVSDDILFEKRGKAGWVTLNRPDALNALNHVMARALSAQLTLWADDPDVARVVITGAGDKAFCAGGDIRSLYDAKRAGETAGLSAFFHDEYLLNAQIKAYPKPYIALIDGIVMGGGVGVSVHGSHRIGTEGMMFAMPETGIGFFPDVGGTYFLPRMPKESGMYCALTAGRLTLGDALATGVLTHAVSASDLPALAVELETADDVDAVLDRYAQAADADAGPVAGHLDLIETCFSASSVAEVLERLDGSPEAFALKAASAIRKKSPTSLMIAFEQLRRGKTLAFADCMKLEYRIVCRVLQVEEFFEGIRAVVVDKDQAPNWQPASLADVDRAGLASYFGEPPQGDLPL